MPGLSFKVLDSVILAVFIKWVDVIGHWFGLSNNPSESFLPYHLWIIGWYKEKQILSVNKTYFMNLF